MPKLENGPCQKNRIIIDLKISEKGHKYNYGASSMSAADIPNLFPAPMGFPIAQLPRVEKFCFLFDISLSSVMITVCLLFRAPLYFSNDFMLPIIATIINVTMLSISIGAILAKMT